MLWVFIGGGEAQCNLMTWEPADTLAVWVYSGAPRCEELFQLRIIHLYQVTLR